MAAGHRRNIFFLFHLAQTAHSAGVKLSSGEIRRAVSAALQEDVGSGDATTLATVPRGLKAVAQMNAREKLVLAGLDFAETAFKLLSRSVKVRRFHRDGDRVRAGEPLLRVEGPARALLTAERVALNFAQRLSGIATASAAHVDAVAGTGVVILDTRKTAPGLRLLDKYAVSCGGGQNHRMDLADGVLIKNNHISLGGGVAKVLALAMQRRPPGQKIQIEVRSLSELDEAIAGGADSLLLDNMTPAETTRAVVVARKHVPDIPIEVSGGITLETVRKYAQTGVTYISVGALTHSVMAIDLSMKITAEIF